MSSMLTCRSSPCCVTVPVTNAWTPRSRAILLRSAAFSLNLKEELRAATLIRDRREDRLIKLSLNPSDIYLVFGLPFPLTNGSPVIDGIGEGDLTDAE